MADNTFNFDLDAPAVPTLTLDPVEAPAAEGKQPEPAAAPEAEQVKLSPEEQAMVDAFAQKIDPLKKNFEEMKSIIREEIEYKGVSVLIPRRECIQTLTRKKKASKK